MMVLRTENALMFRRSLVNNQLSGEIPPELSELSKTLETLKITNNSLTGNIPAEIGNLTQLNFL